MKKHKAQLYDKIQNVIGNYNDRMVRGVFQYSFDINEDIMRDILINFCELSPVMHSAFRQNIFTNYWIEKSFKTEDILLVNYTDNPYNDAIEFICNVLPIDGNVQLRIAIFKNSSRTQSVIAVLTNHMYMDGGDLKYFMKMLCNAYNSSLEKNNNIVLKNGSRSYKTVYDDLDKKIRKKAKLLYSNPTPKNTKEFGLSNKSDSDYSFIITENISSKYFDRIKKYGKNHNATINDIILSSYFLSLTRLCNIDLGDTVTISGAIDLRRYMLDSSKTGITNHSSYLPYTINIVGNDFKSIFKEVLLVTKKYKTDKFTGLYGLPLLNLAYTIFPVFIANKLVKKFYNNPYMAMSNIGILYEDFFCIDKCTPDKAFITGSVKYKPGIMVTVTTYKDEITLSMCGKGNDKDKELLCNLLKNIKETLINIF